MIRRRVFHGETNQVLDDTKIHPGTPQHKTIVRLFNRVPSRPCRVFRFVGTPPTEESQWQPSAHQARQLNSQIKTCLAVHQVHPRDKCLVMEVFSPPRFSLVADKKGFRARSYDLQNGFDLRTSADRRKVENDLLNDPPSLLVLCPPCTDEGGWFHLNSKKWDVWEVLRRKAISRSFIRWCCKLFRLGVQLGCRVVFEHPTGAKTWTYTEVQSLCRRYETVKLHMCRYGMKLPHSERLIRKSTRLLVSHADMQCLGLTCPPHR